jgi:hypothetical protein
MGLREDILEKVDVLAEYQAIGLRVAKGASPSADGWLSCHALGREDVHPSASINLGPDLRWKGIYKDFASGLAMGLFNAIGGHGNYADGNHAFYEIGRKYGVITGERRQGRSDKGAPPTLDDVNRFKKGLSPEVIQYLKDKRGLTEESIARFEIGWDPGRERNTIPVYEPASVGKRLVNIRMHNSKKTPKTLNWSGYGEARLYGADRLAPAPPGSTAILTEGEFDCMVAEQVTGYIGVSSTNGVKAFKPEWVRYFHDHHVVVMYDCDKEGREGVEKLLPYFQEGLESGKILSLKVVWLYPDIDKAHKDVSDWVVKDGGSGEELKKLIEATPPYTYPTSVSHLEAPIKLKSFTEIDRTEYAGRRVTVSLQVYGENTVAYYGPKKIKVTYCLTQREGKCNGGLDGKSGTCLHDIHVPLGDRVLIAGVRATEGQFRSLIQAYVCPRDKRPALRVEDEDRVVVREVFAHQIFEAMQFNPEHQLDKPIYILGGDLVGIGKYEATGRIVASYRDQQPVLLVDTLVHQDEDYQCFDLDAARPHLQKLKAMRIEQMVNDLSYHVTRIYKRWDLHLGVLLVLCSPLWINFPGEGRIRGWLTAIMVGDSGTGKTSISQGLFEFARVGDRVSGLTASRTGITYGLEHDERKGWRVRAGALLKQSRQALIVDEAQDLPDQELKTMAEGIDTGIVKIDRIQQRIFESTTRTIFSCNPRDPKQASEQKKMEDFRHGCQAVQGLFVTMMLRRVDLFLFATSGDIENKEEVFNPPEELEEQQVMAEDLRALIFWAWNLQEDQVVIPSAVGRLIREKSLELSKVFGCDKPPIVYPEDFRKTLARLSAAYAVLDVSANDDFTLVTVYEKHVRAAARFIDIIYRAENCRLHKHAQAYRESYGLEDLEAIKGQIDEKLAGRHCYRFEKIMAQLLRCQKGERLRKADLAEELDVDKKTIQREMSWFVKHRLAKCNINTGYSPEPRLFKLMGRLEKINPEKYGFDKERGEDGQDGQDDF